MLAPLSVEWEQSKESYSQAEAPDLRLHSGSTREEDLLQAQNPQLSPFRAPAGSPVPTGCLPHCTA